MHSSCCSRLSSLSRILNCSLLSDLHTQSCKQLCLSGLCKRQLSLENSFIKSMHACMQACCRFSRVRLFGLYGPTCRAPQSVGFFRQEYWSGLPCPPPGDLPYPGIEPRSPESSALQAILYHLGSPY